MIRGRWVYRDRAEWIPVKVPPIVSRELFEAVHENLRPAMRGFSCPGSTSAAGRRYARE